MVIYVLIFNIISVICIIFYLFIMIFAKKGRGFFKTLLFNAFVGIVVLFIIHLTSNMTNVYLPINYVTMIISGTLGLPGVCGLMLLNIIVLI